MRLSTLGHAQLLMWGSSCKTTFSNEDFDLAVVVNQTQFSKFVHKKAHAGARRTDHLRKRLLADLGDDWLKLTLVCTENLNPHVMVMKTAKDRV
jgi:hypothetical protein